MIDFSYEQAFARNIGWVTADEQRTLRAKRIAIAGLGGVGGAHVLTLARLGVGALHIADFDSFDLANFNRQSGALISTLGRPKAEVLADMVRDINPELDLQIFPDGVSKANLDRFLSGVDVYVDGLDFFAFDARRATFSACASRGVPAITAAPLGMGAALLNFLPGRMTFDDYFRLGDLSEEDQAIRFLLGLSPAMLQRSYLADPRAVDLAANKGPSTVMACQICAGMAATEALKIMLKRGRVYAAPVSLQFDAYRGRLKRTWRPWGNRGPLQRLAIAIARRQLGATKRRTPRRSSSNP
jgi:molybdopterin/thiamine biosynthesis adenylyltransferase